MKSQQVLQSKPVYKIYNSLKMMTTRKQRNSNSMKEEADTQGQGAPVLDQAKFQGKQKSRPASSKNPSKGRIRHTSSKPNPVSTSLPDETIQPHPVSSSDVKQHPISSSLQNHSNFPTNMPIQGGFPSYAASLSGNVPSPRMQLPPQIHSGWMGHLGYYVMPPPVPKVYDVRDLEQSLHSLRLSSSASSSMPPPLGTNIPSNGTIDASNNEVKLQDIEREISSLLNPSQPEPVSKLSENGSSPTNSTQDSSPLSPLPEEYVEPMKPKQVRRPDDKYLKRLSEKMTELMEDFTPEPAEIASRDKLFKTLENILHSVYPESNLYKFGSTSNGFALKNADMDFCFSLPDAEKYSASNLIEKLGKKIEEESETFEDVKILSRARIPIVKLKDKKTGICCDIGFNNMLAVYNTRLLATYAKHDDRLRIMVFAVKHWAKQRQINEPYYGSLSRSVPVLPVLQKLNRERDGGKPEHFFKNYDVYFEENVTSDWNASGVNKQSVGDLLFDFFHFYAYEYPYSTGVISIRTGTILSKDCKRWTKDYSTKKDKYWFCVEDPFELTHNLGRLVDKNMLYDIRGEFIRGCKLMTLNGSLKEICEKYVDSSES